MKRAQESSGRGRGRSSKHAKHGEDCMCIQALPGQVFTEPVGKRLWCHDWSEIRRHLRLVGGKEWLVEGGFCAK